VRAEPTRRLVLAAAGAGSLTLAGCKGMAVLGPRPKPGVDVVSLEHAIAAEETMIARYQSALTALGGPPAGGGGAGKTGETNAGAPARATVARVLAEHREHLAPPDGGDLDALQVHVHRLQHRLDQAGNPRRVGRARSAAAVAGTRSAAARPRPPAARAAAAACRTPADRIAPGAGPADAPCLPRGATTGVLSHHASSPAT